MQKDNGTSPIHHPYMRLPPEIWLQICRLVVKNEGPISVTPEPFECKSALALANTSRWMYTVIMPLFYSQNTFHVVDHSWDTKMFLDSIGMRNLNVITSLWLTKHASTKLPWDELSKMPAIKDISISYPELTAAAKRIQYPAYIRRRKSEPSRDYDRYINSLSRSVHEEGETWTRIIPRHQTKSLRGWASMEQYKQNLIEGKFCPGYQKKTRYSWGIVRAHLRDDLLIIVCLKRQGRTGK